MSLEEFKLYLPKYLSQESERELFDSLKDFPDSVTDKFYTTYLKDQKILLQGDGLKSLLVINLPYPKIDYFPCLVLSNTCDLDMGNKRDYYQSRLVYAPIFKLSKYRKLLEKKDNLLEVNIEQHITSIREQRISSIFYLPKFDGILEESIVFLDRVINSSIEQVTLESLDDERLFTLSDFGFYVLLFKISVHFSRIRENVERRSMSFSN
jgi:hypothetical protein